MRLLSSCLAGLASASLSFSPNCPYFTEDDWVLVRRAKDNAHAATDHLVGDVSFGTPTTDIFDRSIKSGQFHAEINTSNARYQPAEQSTDPNGEAAEFSIDWSGWDYTTFMFASGDCNVWMKVARDEIIYNGSNNPVTSNSILNWIVLESHFNNYPYEVQQYNKASWSGDPAVAFTNNHPLSGGGNPIDCNALYMGNNYEVENGSQDCGGHNGNQFGDLYNGLSVFIKKKECPPGYQYGYTGLREVCWFTADDLWAQDSLTWYMANDHCAAAGGQIGVPRNLDELNFIYGRTEWRHGATLSWTGISNIENNGNLIDHYTGQNIIQYISWDLDGRGQYVAFRDGSGQFIDYGGITTGSVSAGITTGFVCFEAPSCESGSGSGRCISWGDPHIRTFDKSWNDIYEQATYTLAESTPAAIAAGAQYFHAKLETKMVANGDPVSVSDASSLEFTSYDGATSYYIRLSSDGTATAELNGEAAQSMTTTNNMDFQLRIEGQRMTLTTWFGVELLQNGEHVELEVPRRYKSDTGDRTQGVCGNFNCQASDDWTEKDGTTCVGPTYGGGDDDWVCMNKAACSFITNDGDANNVVSCPSTPAAPPVCTDVALTDSCQQLFDDSSFDACKLIVNGFDSFLDACATDICRVDDPDEYRCMLIEMFYKECQSQADPSRDDLDDDVCDYVCPWAKTCPPNMEWNNCAGCEDKYTCQEYIDNYNCNDGYYTVEHMSDTVGACVCIAGYYLENGVCVEQSTCQVTPPNWSEWGEWTDCTASCFPGGTRTRSRLCLGPGECDTQWWMDNHNIDLGSTYELEMCNFLVMCPVETTPPPATTQAPAVSGPAMTDGTCWSGNWTKYFDNDDGSDGIDLETFADHTASGNVNCPMISAVQARIIGNEDAIATSDTISLSGTDGTVQCVAADQDDTVCENYEVRFCCEGCCPYLNISGNPELTDYYENYPGIYELTNETFNDAMVYRLMDGVDEVGNVVYGQGVVYYWEDVGWLLGANTFTYSYYSDGNGEICPQHAPKNWTNEVFGTQLNVECMPVYPSCNDVECVENACCVMREEGPVCECLDGYELYEDGSCLKPTTDPTLTDGNCDAPGHQWSDYLNSDTELGFGDWESLRSFPQVCGNPTGIEASRVDTANTDPQVVHISKEYGFWCINSEQDFQGTNPGGVCVDWEIRVCCPKTEAGSCDVDSGNYAWSSFASHDTASEGIGDFETLTTMGERDICSNPTGVRAQTVDPTASLDSVTHIDASKGFWCLNEEQDSGECTDYEVSFCCPIPKKDDMNITTIQDGTCNTPSDGWTPFMSMDTPSDDGDYETVGNFARMMACENPTGIIAKTNGTELVENVHINVNSGFWCRNDENSEGCADWEVSFCCPMYKTGDCNDGQWTGWYNDEWDKKNERIWVSSREEREDIIMYGDGAACANPTQAEIRPRPTGSTSYQTTMWDYSTNLIDHLSVDGYHCINEEQVDGYKCIDMEVRFCCPNNLQIGDCDSEGAEWSYWINGDDSDDEGDFEVNYRPTTCWDKTLAIQARSVDSSPSYGDNFSPDFFHLDMNHGFSCVNSEQEDGQCDDYEVRYCCQKYQIGECNVKGYEWTNWLNRDDPTGAGDLEMLHAFEPGEACANPIAVKAQDIGDGAATTTHLTLEGFRCLNADNPSECSDFAVSFCCPVDQEVTCANANCGQNEFCLETSSGPKCECGDDDFSVDWDDVDYTRFEDGSCLPDTPTTKTDTDTGEVSLEVGECGIGHRWFGPLNNGNPTVQDGDYEFYHVYTNTNMCENPTAIKATTLPIGDGVWPLHIDLELGFWCVNAEQTNGQCEDFEVSFCCPETQTGPCDQPGYNWTDWYNNDQPDGMGDWEARTDLQCANPTAIRAQTISGNAFDEWTHIDTNMGFWCLNDQQQDGACDEDYEVSYCCATTEVGECDSYGHAWLGYSDLDDPEGLGDLETLVKQAANNVCDAPTGIRARQVNETEETTDTITRISVTEGFVCMNDAFNTCNDYEVSYCCPKWGAGDVHCSAKGHEWTPWINNDDPASGTGDWETRTSFIESGVCSNPTGIQAAPISGGSTVVTHIDADKGFWCINQEQGSFGPCADFEVRYCCPTEVAGSDLDCSADGYEWTKYLDRDDPTEDGDFESLADYPAGSVCDNPTAIDVKARTSGSTAVTHLDLAYGFYCANDEQPNGEGCADFEVRYCCPKKQSVQECNAKDHQWTVWLDRDDPLDSGDYENKEGFSPGVVCQNPTAIQAQKVSGSIGSDAVVNFDNNYGFWCINDQQPRDNTCADFEVRFCCPDVFPNPCAADNLSCATNSHVVFETVDDGAGGTMDQCSCKCDDGYVIDVAAANPFEAFSGPKCIADTTCMASLTECVDFDACVNVNEHLKKKNDANCDSDLGSSSCTACSQGGDCNQGLNENGAGIELKCEDADAFPANNGGTSGFIYCACDGKSDCEWKSDDFNGPLTEEGICVTDSTCPVTPWLVYDGELKLERQRFLNDPLFNTLQSDLYDSDMAEVLGRIETSVLPDFTNYDWSEGHFLVIVWREEYNGLLTVTPYGDYYDMISAADYGDGPLQVWETFVDPLVLRDGSDRDLAANMDVVLDIRHKYDLDLEDVTELLNFRIALIPKSWEDKYGDTVRKNGQEVANCLNSMLNNNAKVDGQLKKKHPYLKNVNKKVKPVAKPTKGKKKPKKTWAQKQAAKKVRGQKMTWKQRMAARQARGK